MAEDHNVSIVSWAAKPLQLTHNFSGGAPCPVNISFEDTPAQVIISTLRDQRLVVNMNMALSAADTLPLCIKLCEPICAESNYTIGISIFDKPVMTITIRGKTRLFGCKEEL
jgi:hypothetical protein